jgi:superfamily II DNA or RNA helicase
MEMTLDPMAILRPYQRDAIEHLWKSWDAGMTRVPMVLATGLGKTKIFTRVVYKWLAENEGKRVLVIAHTDELISQAAAEMRAANPGIAVGIVKAGLNETHCRIIISSRQTLASEKRRAQLNRVGLIIIDEAHHAVRTNTYGKILEHFGAWDEHIEWCACVNGPVSAIDSRCTVGAVKVLGLTATLSRGDKAKLSTVWEDKPVPTFRKDILFGIRNGFLLDVRGERVIVPDLNMKNVKTQGGDYQDASIAEELERTFAPQIVAEKYAEVAKQKGGRLRQGIAFWPLVETAYHGAEAFEGAGIPSAVVHGGLPKEERKLILKRFQAGEITVIHNCMVLTEGFDAPWADVVVIGRPTRNGGLYQQMVGRVLRPDLTVEASLREKALILDVTGAGQNNDLRCLIDLAPERPLKKHDDDDEDFSLLELELELEESIASGSAPWLEDEVYVGPAETKAFDPLHRDKVWAQTPDGTYFMSAGGSHYIFLGESVYGDPGTYDVVWCSKVDWNTPPQSAGSTDYRALPLEEALLWAEEEAISRGGHGAKTLSSRKSKWRDEPASEPLKNKARANGIRNNKATGRDLDTMTKGELVELIDAKIAAKSIDPLVRRLKGAR